MGRICARDLVLKREENKETAAIGTLGLQKIYLLNSEKRSNTQEKEFDRFALLHWGERRSESTVLHDTSKGENLSLVNTVRFEEKKITIRETYQLLLGQSCARGSDSRHCLFARFVHPQKKSEKRTSRLILSCSLLGALRDDRENGKV